MARLREQLMVEKESRLLQMAARQEAEREDRVARVTSSSASSLSSTLSSISSLGGGQGRVRKLFDERRSNGYSKPNHGWDKSHPLDPLRASNRPAQGHTQGHGGQGRPPVAGRQPTKGIVRNGRGVSVDRSPQPLQNSDAMKRSRSHAALQQKAAPDNRTPPRVQRQPLGQTGAPQYKSTPSLYDSNQNYNGRVSSGSSGVYSRETSPVSSPGPQNRSRFGFKSRGASPTSNNRNASPANAPYAPRRTETFKHTRNDADDEVDNPPHPPPRHHPKQRPQPPPKPKPQPSPARLRPQPTSSPHPSESRSRGPSATPSGVYDDHVDVSRTATPRTKPTPKTKPSPPPKSNKLSPPKPGGSNTPESPGRRVPSAPPPGLTTCSICGRNFATDRIEKHHAICEKSQQKAKKRKVFDPVKMRTKGTEAEQFVAKGEHLKEKPKPKKVDWRKKHEDFIATVRAAKGIQGYEAPPMDTSDYVECPHCGRKFSEGAAERHIPKCSSIQSNKMAPSKRR